ncbi:MAG: glycosyltransferase [Prevotella sp.]|nr:glycosyltransferase [Prevotella sp.]
MKLSVITVNYNNNSGLEKTINSVIGQTGFDDFEYIIIDGGSSDGSREVIERHKDYLDYWCSEPDKGIFNAMNKGVEHAKGEYVIFMNSGDCFYNENVLKSLFVGKEYEADIITGQVVIMGTNTLIRKYNDNLSLQLYNDTINHQGSFIKKKLLNKVKYDESLKIVSDWKFWIETIILGNARVLVINNIIAEQDMTGISSNLLNKETQEKEREEVLTSLIPKSMLIVFQELSDIHQSIYYRRIKCLMKYSPFLYRVSIKLLAVFLLLKGVTNKKLLTM